MKNLKRKAALKAIVGALVFGNMSLPALAQDASTDEAFAILDELSDATVEEPAGIALAVNLADQGKYLEALAALERVLAAHPKSHNARILHAVFLCDIDDKQGGLVELAQIKKKHVGEEAMRAAMARCGEEAE